MIDRIVARVNDDVITLSELQEEGLPLFERLRANYTGKERVRPPRSVSP